MADSPPAPEGGPHRESDLIPPEPPPSLDEKETVGGHGPRDQGGTTEHQEPDPGMGPGNHPDAPRERLKGRHNASKPRGNDREQATIYTCGAANEERRGGFAAIVSWEHETGDMRSTITGGQQPRHPGRDETPGPHPVPSDAGQPSALEDAVVTIHDDGGLMARSVAIGIQRTRNGEPGAGPLERAEGETGQPQSDLGEQHPPPGTQGGRVLPPGHGPDVPGPQQGPTLVPDPSGHDGQDE